MTPVDARAYFRTLAAIHLAWLLMPMGMFFVVLRLPAVAAVFVVLGAALWCGAILAVWIRSIRHRDGRNWIGPDSVWSEANLWTGWGLIDEASEAANVPAGRVHAAVRNAVKATLALAALFIVAFPVSSLFT